MKTRALRWVQGVVVGLVLLSAAEARPVTYEFVVTATDGPLQGQTSVGTFTFDRSLITDAYSVVAAPDLITQLSFDWNGVHFDETSANTGALAFEGGRLIYTLFGNECYGGGCGMDGTLVTEWVAGTYYDIQPLFEYRTFPDPNIYEGTTVVIGPLPEPATASLALVGLLGWAGLRSRTRSR